MTGFVPCPRRLRRRGRSSAQLAQEERAVTERVLSLPACPRNELEKDWRRLWDADPPRYASRELLVRAVAYGLQAEVFGGLDAQTLRLLQRASQSNSSARRPWRTNRLAKGSKLFREWHGEMHEVLVLDKGFAWRGETHRSLSSIARAITSAHWNGWAFFGLKHRKIEVSVIGREG